MNVYSLIPLIATLAYIPLLISTASSRPLSRRHVYFILFLLSAMMWSLTDYIFRNNFFPEYSLDLLKAILVFFMLMGVQLHLFSSSSFPRNKGRWLPFAYSSLFAVIVLILMNYTVKNITVTGDELYPHYDIGIIVLALALIVLVARNLFVFHQKMSNVNNPVQYNQIFSLTIGITIMFASGMIAMLPWWRELPLPHIGNLMTALILSYSTIRHELVDIRIVLRRGLAWMSLGIIGIICFIAMLFILHIILDVPIDLKITLISTLASVFASVIVYRIRGMLFIATSWMLQGRNYEYRQQLSDFANKIQNIFTLKDQGGELLALVTQAIGSTKACLLFPEAGSEDFVTQLVEPKNKANPMSGLTLKKDNPIVNYLERERKLLRRETLAILPEFQGLWGEERKKIESSEIELFVPLISRGRLISILVMDKKRSGRYMLDDQNLLENISNQVAVSMEKEYLREQLRQREEELSVINRSSTIITSSLDIQEIYDSFIKEIKNVVDVNWAAIVLLEENDLYFLALSSDIGSPWQVGERIPIKGSATEWVAGNRKTIVEPDLAQETKFSTGKYHLGQGIHSIAYMPLIARGEPIGTLIVASRKVNAYGQRHVTLLEQLASQIAMPVGNALLYAKTEEKARIDELTGLLNHRSLNEMINSEIGRHSRYGGVFSMILLDLDSFKDYNDKYGHLAGDRLLRQIGNIIRSTTRGADQTFRYGGDEFAVLLPQTSMEAALPVAERIRRQIILKVSKLTDMPVTASLGLSTWPADGIGPDEIIVASDVALYEAKRNGGNQSCCSAEAHLTLPDNKAGFEGSQEAENRQEAEALNTVYTLAATVDARDHYTASHSKKVAEYALTLGKALNLQAWEINRLETCALLHDIGKIAISDEILKKKETLSGAEWDVIKGHSQLGAIITGRINRLAPCAAGILHHHEKYDGTGYPGGQKGDEIPLEARILAIADAFAAMTSDRPHSSAQPVETALEEIKRGSGAQFDPHLVEIFTIAINGKEPFPEEIR